MHADPKTAAASPDDTAKAKEAARLMAMKMLVITLGVILVALAVVVFSTLAIRAVKGGGQGTPPGTSAAQSETGVRRPVQLSLPSGSRIISTTLGEGRLAVTTEGPEGAVIVLFDARTLAETGRIQVPTTR